MPENTEENQPITNLKPRTFANTTVTSKKAKVYTLFKKFSKQYCGNFMKLGK